MNRNAETGDRSRHTSRRRILATTGSIGLGLLAGCLGAGGGSDGDENDTSGGGMDDESTDGGSGTTWRTTELTDVLTDETFSIRGLDGPVVVQSFAVWCPKCQRQSEELSTIAESVTLVGLNIDPNEDAAKVRRHAERNGFDWRFAVAPTEMTDSLVEEFGPAVTNAPSTPIIVVCDDGETEFFSGSQQSAQQIQSTVAEC